MKELTDEEKREVYRRAASNMGITEEQARRELDEMAEVPSKLQAQAERLARLLREGDSRDNWTVEPLAEKSQVLVTAEQGRPNEEGWLRTSVVFSLNTLENLNDDELAREVHTRVKVYRMGM